MIFLGPQVFGGKKFCSKLIAWKVTSIFTEIAWRKARYWITEFYVFKTRYLCVEHFYSWEHFEFSIILLTSIKAIPHPYQRRESSAEYKVSLARLRSWWNLPFQGTRKGLFHCLKTSHLFYICNIEAYFNTFSNEIQCSTIQDTILWCIQSNIMEKSH